MNTPELIFEDNEILAFNKPANWVVNDAISTIDRETLQSYLQKNFKYPLANNSLKRSGIVHRLDKMTSGVILVAKTEEVFEFLQKQFFERSTEKVYTALVHGRLKQKEGVINAKVGRLPWNRTRFGVLENGREAVTHYKVLNEYIRDNEHYSLVELYPKTGRTHQIRIHLKHIGNPIVTDAFYSGRKTYKKDLKFCPRMFLHAKSISFRHPNGETINIEAPLSEELSKVIDILEEIKS